MVRKDQTLIFALPAHQGFRTDEQTRVQIHFGLQIHAEFFLLQCAMHMAFHIKTHLLGIVKSLVVDADCLLFILFPLGQRRHHVAMLGGG